MRAYYVSKLIADLPLQLICPVLFVVIAYFMTGQPFECDRLMMLLAICILMAVMAHSLGLVAGAAFSVKVGLIFCILYTVFIFYYYFYSMVYSYYQQPVFQC